MTDQARVIVIGGGMTAIDIAVQSKRLGAEHVDIVYRRGPDDMSAHVRTLLTRTSIAIPVHGGRCDLGTWQGVYLWEHRHGGSSRRIAMHVTT